MSSEKDYRDAIGLDALRPVRAAHRDRYLFVEHGMQKLFDFPASGHGAVPLFSFIGFAGSLELVGGFLILIGLLTRPAAFILAGEMAVAYWTVHAAKSFPRWSTAATQPSSSASCFCISWWPAAAHGASTRC